MKTTSNKFTQIAMFILLMACIAYPMENINAQNRVSKVKSAGKSRPVSNRNASSTAAKRDRVKKAKRDSDRKTNINSGNNTVNINVDKSKDIRINNRRNTTVRHNSHRPYSRPAYRHGGRRYHCYHPYRYHHYRPYHWGGHWHPWGFFITTVAKTAIIISVANQQYHYDEGVYYVAGNGGYTVVQAPIGAVITTLPPKSQTVVVNQTTNNYYYGGTFYEKSDSGYTVVPPTAGTTIENLSEGGKEVKIGKQTYVQIGETFYQPVTINGKEVYEVVLVEQDK